MINAGILDGDYVLVEQRSTARDGDMVVAMVADSATVKTYYKEAITACSRRMIPWIRLLYTGNFRFSVK